MSLLHSLNRRYYRATTDQQRAEILAAIRSITDMTTCMACGEPVEDGACFNPRCPEGVENLAWDAGDQQYHARADAEVQAYFLSHDL